MHIIILVLLQKTLEPENLNGQTGALTSATFVGLSHLTQDVTMQSASS